VPCPSQHRFGGGAARATRARIAGIFAWEFAFLGLATAVAALGVGTLGAMALTLAFGLAGTLAALRQRPLSLLRSE